MRYESKTAVLRDGRCYTLRSPGPDDAPALLRHLVRTSGETDYMLRYPDEITLTEAQEREYLAAQERDPASCMICALDGGVLVANAGFYPAAPYDRTRHRAEFGISILRTHWGRGIGTALLRACLDTARAAGYAQMELEVVADNLRGQALYRAQGFTAYGRREDTFRYRDGRRAAAVLMVCPLRRPEGGRTEEEA